MTIRGEIARAPAGVIGFDTPERLNSVRARQYFNKGYRFCVRYVSHDKSVASRFQDLTEEEGQIIVDAGMALMVVQHPLKEGWTPTEKLGRRFGQNAAAYASDAGVPQGVNVWLDLEGVKAGTPDTDVIAFCNAWFNEVDSVGYESGVYVGASPGLNADQLYWDLKTKHYWKGGSSAKAGVPDDIPHRGYQLIQRIQNAGTAYEFDSDVTKIDNFGDGVMWLANAPTVA